MFFAHSQSECLSDANIESALTVALIHYSMIPHVLHPRLKVTVQALLERLLPSPEPLHRILTFPRPTSTFATDGNASDASTWRIGARTYIMATLNTTPDSFSDGGDHFSISDGVAYALAAVKGGADIIDVGGYSTKPGAVYISDDEEIQRVVPVIRAIRQAGVTTPISIDTFRARVAVEAVNAGATCINDVRALREPGMLEAVQKLGVPVIMMHSRADAGADKDYGADGVMEGIRRELGAEVKRALRAGVRRWNIVADPGVGFSKTVDGNLEIIRNLRQFTNSIPPPATLPAPVSDLRALADQAAQISLTNLPVLVGTSRKSYLGVVIGRSDTNPKARGPATAAACSAAIQQGCDILRVHDVQETKDIVAVSDSLWRIERI